MTATVTKAAVDTPAAAPARRARRRIGKVIGDWVPVVPFMLLGGGLLVAAALWLIVLSVHSPDGGWNLDAWQKMFRPGRVYRDSIITSVEVSVWTCTICTIVGTPLAWYLHNLRGRPKAIVTAITNTTANFVGVSLSRAFISTFGAAGFVTVVLRNLVGFDLGNMLFSTAGLVAIYCYFTLPLYVLLLAPAMNTIKPAWWEAVQVASGSRWMYWREVGLPVLAPFVLSGWVLTFAWSMGQFSVPAALLGQSSGTYIITLRIGTLVGEGSVFGSQAQQAAAYAVLLMVIATAALLTSVLIARRPLRRLGVG